MDIFETTELERSYLRLITKSKMHANISMHSGKDDFFTDPSRKFIYKLAKRVFAESRSILSKDVLVYEIRHKIDPADQVYFEAEWNLISNLDISSSPDSVLERLAEADVARKVMATMEKSVDLIGKGDVSAALAAIKLDTMQISMTKNEQPIRKLTDFEERKAGVLDRKKYPEKYTGLKTGIFPTLDKKTGGFFKGELTLLAGVTGLGKSTLVKALQWGIVMNNPHANVLHIANEEYSEQVEHKFDALITEIPYLDFKFGNISDENLEKWEAKMLDLRKKAGKSFGEIYSKEVPAFTDVTLVEQAYRELEAQGVKIDIIIIDHLPHIVPIMKSYGENDERWKATADCKELARSLKVPVIIPTQAATDVEKKQVAGKRADKLDVYGSKGQIHVANNFFIITSTGKDNTQVDRPEYERDVYWLVDCKKNRDGPPFSFKAKHHVYFGKVVEVSDGGFTGSGDFKADDESKNAANEILEDLDRQLGNDKEVSESPEKPAEAVSSDTSSNNDTLCENAGKEPEKAKRRSSGKLSAIRRLRMASRD